MKKIPFVLAFVAGASLAMAAVTPVTSITVSDSPLLRDLQDVTSGGNTYTRLQLAVGTTFSTNGATTYLTNYANVDDAFVLSTIVAGVGQNLFVLPVRTILFAGQNFTSTGSPLDFFIFEAGATSGDAISVAPVYLDGSVGTSSTAIAGNSTGWGNTGITVAGPVQGSQFIQGTSFSITDLKDNSGVALSASATISGIAITAGPGVDVAGVYAVVPAFPIDHFQVTTNGSDPQMVGVAFDVTITAKDSGNNTVSTGSAVVSVAAVGSLMEFDWNNDGIYGDNSGTLVAGVKTIKARNKRAETAAIVASSGSATTPTAPFVTTTAEAYSKLQVLAPGETAAAGTTTGKTGNPNSFLVGTPFNVTVNAVDLYWNIISAAPGDVIAITTTDNTATLPADAALVSGTQVFSVTFNQRGNFTVTATNTSNALITNGVSSPIVSSVPLVWKGDGSANLWNTNNALNWTNVSLGVTYFANGEPVTFDDSGSTTPAVSIVGTVTPASVTLDSANNYAFISTNGGGIGGTARLTKTGAGNLTLSTSNSYSGGTVVTGGLLVLSNANALPGSGAFIMTNNMVVLAAGNLTRGSVTIQGPIAGFAAVGANRTVNLGNLVWGNANFFTDSTTDILVLGRASDSFTLDFQTGLDFGLGGNRIIQVDNGAAAVDAVISGRIQDLDATPGTLIKTGAGTLQLTHPTSNYEGPTEIQDGVVILTGGFDPNNIFVLGNGTTSGVLQLGDASTIKDLTVGSLTISGTGTGNRVVGGNASVSTLTVNTAFAGDVVFDGVLGGPGANQNNLALAKNGTGTTLTLTASNTYSGVTIINSGTLALTGSGSINNSPSIEVTSPDFFDVSAVTGGYVLGAGQTLKGLGTVMGNVTAKGQIRPGSTGIGTLTFNNDLTLTTSTAVMEINNTNSLNSDRIATFGTFTPGGVLVVTNIGGQLNLGDTFTLFSPAVVGSFSSIQYPPAPSGTTWTNQLAVDGSIALVAAPAPIPTNITFSVSGGNLILNWPAGQGWKLQSQTNALTVGISTNWVTVPGAVPPLTNAVNPANGSVFYRLVYP